MSFLPAVGTSVILGGVTGIGAVGSAVVSRAGTSYFCTLSEKCAENQRTETIAGHTWKAAAWRVAKAASLALSALVGTLGALATGLYVSTLTTLFSGGVLTPLAIGAGVGTGLGLELAVILKILQQIKQNRAIATAPVAG